MTSPTESLLAAQTEARETLTWIEDWRAGLFTPAYHGSPWPVEMHGLVITAEQLAKALLGLSGAPE